MYWPCVSLNISDEKVKLYLGYCFHVFRLLGTPFYIMEHVPGRIFKNPLLPDQTPEERRQIYSSMCETLAKIHKVNITEAGLDDFGKKGACTFKMVLLYML